MSSKSFITTYSGISFNPLNPKAEDISSEDIAHALSLLCRANGHFKHFYSVAQHSLNCAKEAKARHYSDRVQFACLLHDASEAYMSDVTRPVKAQLKEYVKIEEDLQNLIFKVYGLGDLTAEERGLVKKIDDEILQYEMALLFPHPHELKESKIFIGKDKFEFLSMERMKAEFIERVGFYQDLFSN